MSENEAIDKETSKNFFKVLFEYCGQTLETLVLEKSKAELIEGLATAFQETVLDS